MPKSDLESRLLRAISDMRRVEPGETWVVAVSGGVDSMVLLRLLVQVNQARSLGLALHVAHVNHQLRRQHSDEDAEFVAAQARELRLACSVERAEVSARAREGAASIELAARQCRYEIFERLCLKLNAHTVVLAHHADDNIETVLHRLVRGTGVRGLGGIRPLRPIREGSDIVLFRPMLGMRRAEIERYAAAREIRFRTDATNGNTTFSRNRIRHELLPFIRERFNPQVDEAVSRLSEQARGLEAYLRETCSRMLESIVVEHNNRQLVVHGPSLARRPRVIQTQLIREVILRLGLGEGEITFNHLSAVADLLASEQGSKELHLPGGLRVVRRYARLVFETATPEPMTTVEQEVLVWAPGVTPLPAFGMELEVESLDATEEQIAGHLRGRADRGQLSYEEWLDAEQVHPPLIARARRPGDRFYPLGGPGIKKLSDFFIDEKIEVARREKVVILCDQLGPVWVVPLRIDDRARLHPRTRRVLRVVARATSH